MTSSSRLQGSSSSTASLGRRARAVTQKSVMGASWEAEPTRPGPASRPRGPASSNTCSAARHFLSSAPTCAGSARRFSLGSRCGGAWLRGPRMGVPLGPTSQPNCGRVAPPEISNPQTPCSSQRPLCKLTTTPLRDPASHVYIAARGHLTHAHRPPPPPRAFPGIRPRNWPQNGIALLTSLGTAPEGVRILPRIRRKEGRVAKNLPRGRGTSQLENCGICVSLLVISSCVLLLKSREETSHRILLFKQTMWRTDFGER